MEKKGQVTIFIVVAIVLIGIVGLYFSLRGELKVDTFTPESEEIYLFVENCIESTAEEAIYSIGQSGGYFLPPELSTDSGIPYYYYNGQNYMPYKEEIEEEVSEYINEMLSFCVKNFVDFPEFNISEGEIKTETKILDNKVVLNIEYPINIKKGESTTRLKNFENIEIPVRLGIVYDAVGKIIQDQLGHENICLSCILDIVLENDLYTEMIDYDEETIIFIIRDENSKIDDKSFEFIFANKYNTEK